MTVIRRSLSVTGVWLVRKVTDMANALARRPGALLQDKKIVEGYLLIAKKTQGVPDQPGIPPALQSIQVRNSIRLTALVLDLPAYVCLPGRYYVDGEFDPDKAYVQTLAQGRDSYMPGAITEVLPAQTSPLTRALAWKVLDIGSASNGTKLATRFWGCAQPFPGAGCMYGYGAVYLSDPTDRNALGMALPSDPFVYRLDVFTPTYARLQKTDSGETLIPENPTALPASWSVQIPESAITGAAAFVRIDIDREALDPEDEGIYQYWEAMQYPWLTFSPPKEFTDDSGNVGYTVYVCGQVVFEKGGPYYNNDDNPLITYNEVSNIPAAGARGLWVAQLQVVNGAATIISQTTYNGLSDDDERRQPWTSVYTNPFPFTVYQSNVTYKSTPVTLDNGTMVMAVSSFVTRKQEGGEATPPIPPEEGLWMFCDIVRVTEGVMRRHTISTTKVTRILKKYDDGDSLYLGGVTAFDAGNDENRCVIGTATDGDVAVSIVFSAFRPTDRPRMRVIVSTDSDVSVEYDGIPDFSMMMGSGGDETVAVGYIDAPTNPAEQKFWCWMTSDNQVAYMGNGKFCFYCSTAWSTPPTSSAKFVVSANLAMAVYDRGASAVSVQGVIDSALSSSGTTTGFALTQIYSGSRVGNIEVLRQESDGYIKGGSEGHPAVMIVTRGKGAPAVTIDEDEGLDINNGQTWISYDSGETWQAMLDLGSPVGAFHCGNIAQPRTEPVVRV